jgi:hypothetical protein
MTAANTKYWPSARSFNEAVQCPGVCFSDPSLRLTQPAVDRLGMPLVTSGQFAYVYKLRSTNGDGEFAVRCFRGYLGDRDQRYRSIEKHLRRFPLAVLSGFTYDPEGILVNGNRFPITFMKWIDGPTLDSYVAEMLGRSEVLLHLAAEWLKLIDSLNKAQLVHGDLQHGNIIVERGQLRLVDHDGIFVPEMRGWQASELGHQHYQHPRREASLFDGTLDNFSALVIYLSLRALAEQPVLWQEHHDENLLFTKSDFLEPAASSLFGKIKLLGPELSGLAVILEQAALGAPAAVPSLVDLVNVKSSLPAWMNAPLDLELKAKTREVALSPAALAHREVRWRPWQARRPATNVPATPPTDTVQTIFSGPAMTPSTAATIKDPTKIWRNTPTFAKDLLTKNFLWWYWGIYLCLLFLGIDFFYAILIGLFMITAVALTYGFIQAQRLANAPLPPLSLSNQSLSAHPSATLVTGNGGGAVPMLPASAVLEPVIGNRALNIYHAADCAWVERISARNRVGFHSQAEAVHDGYKACRICLPLS